MDTEMNQIRNYLEKMEHMSDEDWQIFSSRLVRHQLPKKTVLLKTGETENYLSFIEKGMVRLFIPKSETDLTFGFVFENEFVSAYDSFLTRQASPYSIETLTPVTVWRLTYEDLQAVYRDTRTGNVLGRRISEELFLKKSKRELAFLNETAEQRYLRLFTDRPDLIRQIPLKFIASYIGITPQALSRIRRRIC